MSSLFKNRRRECGEQEVKTGSSFRREKIISQTNSMPAWSSLRGLLRQALAPQPKFTGREWQRRMMSDHKTMEIKASRWQWNKFKDIMHFYFLLGLIPVSAIIMYTNIFIGPAKLVPIPEGYTPKYWEYHRHPITRFLARHFYNDPQQEYEKYMHMLYEKDEIRKIYKVQKEVKAKIRERIDYQAFYFAPFPAKRYRQHAEDTERLKVSVGVEDSTPIRDE